MTRTRHFAGAAVPVLLATLLTYELVTGRIYLYIHDRSTWLVVLSVPLLLALASVMFKRSAISVGGRGWSLAVVPFAVAALVPAHPLGAAALDAQNTLGVGTGAVFSGLLVTRGSLEVSPAEQVWDIKQLGLIQASASPAAWLDGQRADLVGFVHRTDALATDQFQVGRFLVRCCTADAVAVTVPVRYAHAADLAQDTWVDVKGTLRVGGDGAEPLLEAESVRVVDEPTRPYLQLP
jgi:putative membrane protein